MVWYSCDRFVLHHLLQTPVGTTVQSASGSQMPIITNETLHANKPIKGNYVYRCHEIEAHMT